jgi:succinate-acetate transporter protein
MTITTNSATQADVSLPVNRAPGHQTVSAANPMLLGAPALVVGAVALALFLYGYRSEDNSLAGPIPIMVFYSGLSTLLATTWSVRRDEGPTAAIFGLFTGFWLSLAMLQLGLTNSWYGRLDLIAQGNATANFLLTWFVAICLFTVASLRLPRVYTLLFTAVDVSLLMIFFASISNSATTSRIMLITGTISLGVFIVLGCYLFIGALGGATVGRSFPLGSPLLRR